VTPNVTENSPQLKHASTAGRREWMGLGVLALPCLLYSMDLTVLNLAVPALSRALAPSSTQLLWIVDIWIMSFSAGAGIGPLVGGALLEHFWWGSAFLVGVPVMALLLAVGPVLLPEFRDPRAGGLDWLSASPSGRVLDRFHNLVT
jgi:MFS family permease